MFLNPTDGGVLNHLWRKHLYIHVVSSQIIEIICKQLSFVYSVAFYYFIVCYHEVS